MNASSFAAVCFDFDGTLADNFAAIAKAVNYVRLSKNLGPMAIAEVRGFVGRGIEYLIAHTVPRGSADENVASYRAYFPSVMREGTTLLPGAAQTLASLHEAGLQLALCSNKSSRFSRELLGYLNIAAYFSIVLGPEDVGKPKPAPDMLMAAMARIGAAPEQTLYVGDMVIDIETARAAGVPVWVVPTGPEPRVRLEAALPDRVLETLLDLL